MNRRKCLKEFVINFNNVCDIFFTHMDALLMVARQPVWLRNCQSHLESFKSRIR